MKKIILPCFILFSGLVVSCKDDNSSSDEIKLVKSIVGGDENIRFNYNEKRQLVKIIDTDSESIFTYDESGKLSKYVIIYNEGSVQSTESFTIKYQSETQLRIVDEDNEYVIVNLNDKGQVLNINNGGDVTKYTYDTKGNIVKVEEDGLTTTVTYNNDKGIFSGTTSPKWMLLLPDYEMSFFSVNNPVSISSIITENGQTTTDSEIFTYPVEHIIKGYPTRISVNYNENGTVTNQIYNISY